MKYKFLFVLILGTLGCNKEIIKNKPSCQSLNGEVVFSFKEGSAARMMISPFDKNKVLVDFQKPKSLILECDLSTKEQSILNSFHWKRIYRDRDFVYNNPIDSLVWIADRDTRKLLKYNRRTQKAEYLALNYIMKIFSSQSKTYFASRSGLFYWDTNTHRLRKVSNIPLQSIRKVQLLNENTLILNDKITFDFQTNTWEDGVRLYNSGEEGNYKSFLAEDGIVILQKESGLYLSTPDGVKPLNLDNRLGMNGIKIKKPFIYGRSNNFIERYHSETGALKKFRYKMPKVNNSNLNFIYEDEIIWIYRAKQLHFINTITQKSYRYDFENKERFVSMLTDDCKVYLLFEDKMVIKDKEKFIRECPSFDIDDYLAQLDRYKKYIDSIGIRKDKNVESILRKIDLIKSEYSDVNHPEIQKELEYLNVGAFQGLVFETDKELEGCYSNQKLPVARRVSCLQRLNYKEARNANFKKVLENYEVFTKQLDDKEALILKRFQIDKDSIEQYFIVIDSLNRTITREDSLAYKKAMALNTACHTSFFCHGGCGGCDAQLVIDSLTKFIEKYPNSRLREVAEWDLLQTSNSQDIGTEYSPKMIAKYRDFIKRFPASNSIAKAKVNIAFIYFANNESIEEQLRSLEKATLELVGVQEMHHELVDSRLQKRIDELKRQIKEKVLKTKFDLVIKPEKEYFKIGENIIINVEMINKTNQPQPIVCYAEKSCFSTMVNYSRGKPEFIPSPMQDSSKTNILIDAHSSIKETIVLNKKVRFRENGDLGHYRFDKSHECHLTVFLGNMPLSFRSNYFVLID